MSDDTTTQIHNVEPEFFHFGMALAKLKCGFAVRREGWNGKGMCLRAKFPDKNSKMTHPYLYITIPDCEEGERQLLWQPAQVDIFSVDWSNV